MSLRLMSAVISPGTSTQNKPEDSDKIVKQLLECVQECQKRYGGKTELATEFDSCVIGLCLTLECVFFHGLRVKPQDNQQTSALKQVSEIVASSLHIGNDKPSFWPFINKHLTKHERERYIALKNVWTDAGRSRAWLRSTLNERSLERYFISLLGNQEILKSYYENWALLRDDEKSSMLPNMSAGLGSILFAISIDKPELNSGIVSRSDVLKIRPEPIIEAPLPETKKPDRKKKKKVARQFISFDEEDSMLSTSVPSSSSSISSESNSVNETSSSKSRTSLSQISEESKKADTRSENTKLTRSLSTPQADNAKLKRSLSIETSGSRDKFASEIPETLTPVTQAEIGELTPVSVEVNTHFESPNMLDDTLEVPTDISAVLTAVESKNKEDLKKMQDKIDSLAKENGCLKEQVNKYIGAIKMLRKDDDDDEFPEAIRDLDFDDQPDYKTEAKIFEKKLVQVAEMHAELMDFNVMLQQSLCKKDTLLERLRNELEALRGPMPTDEIGDEMGGVNIWIPSAFLTGSGSSSHHVYQIFIRAGNDEWNIYRRYAQFYVLHTDLKKLDPSVTSFDFPPKKSIGKKDAAIVEDRRKRLQTYLRKVLAHWPELSHCNSRYLLEQHLAFFKDIKENGDRNKRSMFASRRSVANSDNHYTGL